MDRYEQLAVVGEGSYGVVLKCRHRETDQVVAIKKFLETEEDAGVRRMALREIRMLKKLRHENLVMMIEVFRHRKRFYLVFEYVEGTVLDELDKVDGGLGDEQCRERIYQVTRAVNFCHSNNIVHRDVKPENVLVSSLGVVKLCDFGFARLISTPGELCTEYVATRWYRAPELLVSEQQYGPAVDIWAIGCLFAEMMTGAPLFPGESDIDQLYLIVKTVGKPCLRHQQLMAKNSQLRGMVRSTTDNNNLYTSFADWSLFALDFLTFCMKMDPQLRPTADDLLKHNYFAHDKFPQRFLPALRSKVNTEFNSNPLLRKHKADVFMSTDRKDEIKVRRFSQTEPPRWRMSLIEGSIKRKFSCDNSSENRPSTKSYSQRTGMTFLKQSTKSVSTQDTEINRLEKSLENLSKISHRPTSEKKHEAGTTDTIPIPFQSLQSFHLPMKSFQPTISTITFKEPPKKSPNILQSIHNTSIKNTFHQVPLCAPRGSFLKKLDNSKDIPMFVNIEPLNLHHQAWSLTRKKDMKNRDNFTLPCLPGATTSPVRTRRASSPDPLGNVISPRTRYQLTKRKYLHRERLRQSRKT